MGKRDYKGREAKKTKKDAKGKVITTTVVTPQMPVEVIRKERKKRDEED
jgi:hypothetical protein